MNTQHAERLPDEGAADEPNAVSIAVDILGGPRRAGLAMGQSRSTVHGWVKHGLPPGRAIALRDAALAKIRRDFDRLPDVEDLLRCSPTGKRA